jgi:TRAP-type C4-dicarboxylate transport system substrate-binding protein
MANFEVPYPDTAKIFEGAIAKANLDRVINIELLADVKSKEVYEIVKSNKITKHATKNDVYIVINDTIFDGLEEWQQLIIAEEAITCIIFNDEKDKVEIKKGDVGVTKRGAFSGILSKYGAERYDAIQESVKTLYNVKQEEAEL